MAGEREDAEFTIIRVTTNGIREDGIPTGNKYTIDVEVPYGVFPAVVPRGTGRVKLTQPLKASPGAKALVKKLEEEVKRLEAEGNIGGADRAVLELAAPSPGAAERTARVSDKLRELNNRKPAGKP